MLFFAITSFICLLVLSIVISNKMDELDRRFTILFGRVQALEEKLEKYNL